MMFVMMSHAPSARLTRALLLIVGLMITAGTRSPVAEAADNFWTGGAGNGNFSDNANWNSPPSWGFGNSLVFQANASAPTLTNNETWRDNNDIFWNTAFPVARTLQSTGDFGLGFKIRLENLSSFTQTVTMPLSGGLNNAGQIQLNPVNGSLILSGTLYNENSVDYVVFGSPTATVTNLTLNTALGPNATQAGVDFTVAGGRNTAVQVNASQLWAGTTDVQSGSFTTANGVTLASSAILVSGGTVATTSANTLADAAALTVNSGRLSIGGSDTVGSLAGSGGAVDLAAGVTLTAGGANTNTAYAGSITGSGNFAKVGSGTFTLSAVSGMTGTTTVSAGQFSLGGSNLLADTSAVAVAGGVLALGGNSDTVGTFTISGGSLTGSGTVTAANYTLGGGTVSANLGSGTMNVTGNASLNGTSNGTTLTLSSGTLTLGSAGRLAATSAVAVTGSAGGALTLGGNETIGSLAGAAHVATGSNTLTVGGDNTSTIYSGGLSGAGAVTKVGNGTLTLSGSNTFSGPTTIAAGTLRIGDSGTTGSLASSAIVNNGVLTIARSDAVTLAANVSGTGSVTKSGAGTLTLTGSNTFSGITTIAVGTLRIGDGGTTGSLASSAIVNNGVLTIDRSDSVTLAADVSGTGSVTKSGAGTTTLSGSNSYTGGTVISQGTLSLGSSTAIGAVGSVVFGGGKLQYTAANTTDYSSRFVASLGVGNYAIDTNGQNVTFASQLTGSGLDKFGAGILTLTGSNTYFAPTNVFGGTLRFNGNSSGVIDTVNVYAGATLGGTGRIGGAVNVAAGGTLAPGASVESLATGGLSFNGGSFAYEVDSTAPLASAGDLVVVTGGLLLSTPTPLSLADVATNPAAFPVGTVLTLINYTGSWNNGLFSYDGTTLVDGATFTAGLTDWMIDYNATVGGVNFTGDLVAGSYVTITAVPEPSAWAVALAGLACGGFVLRRRKRG